MSLLIVSKIACQRIFVLSDSGVPRTFVVDESLVCNVSNESYLAVLSCGTVYYAVQGGSNF